MSPTEVTADSKIERVWRQADLGEFPELQADAPYGEERERLRWQVAVFKGWTAWQLQEYRSALNAFHAALDRETRDAELNVWMLHHLLERQPDYLKPPANGAWPERSLRPDASAPGTLLEQTLPSRALESSYDETTVAALQLLHRLLLAEPVEIRRAAPVYFAYHAFVEPTTEMVLAPISSGSFLMGSPDCEPGRYADESPQHRVTLKHDFWLGIHPVTQKQYEAVTGANPSEFKGPNRPVEKVSWEDAVSFCEKLTDQAVAAGVVPDGYAFRLPSEAEWEYCCRAGTETATAFGDSLSSEQANFNGNHPYGGAKKGPYLERSSDVGSYNPNAWGLYDMHGNVREWCPDAAERDENGNVKTDTYVDGVVDPLCKVGRLRVNRGGSWNRDGRDCRSAYRHAHVPGDRRDILGFRVCLARSPAGGEP